MVADAFDPGREAALSQALDEGGISQEDLSMVAGVLHDQSGQLSRLVEDLMALARVEASEYTLMPEIVDVSLLTGGVVDSYRSRADHRAAKCHLHLYPVHFVGRTVCLDVCA